MENFRYVILGGGMVAGYAAKEFAERGLAPGELAIVSADDALPYERPPLSKGFLRGAEAESFINDAAFYRDHGIEMKLETPVERVDLAGRSVHFSGGEWRYEKLLIATGCRVRKFHVPGGDLEGLFYLRSLDDSKHIRASSEQAKRAVVIGGGFIGMEVASSLRQRGLEVTLLISEDRIWERLFTPQMSRFFQDYYEQRGVRCLTGVKITGFAGSGKVERVQLAGGASLEADIVVAGIGVLPATELFAGTGIATDDGISVNEYLETGIDDVYAAGDVACYRDLLSLKNRRVEHWDNAVSQGQHVARVMSGAREPFLHVPYFFSDDFDLSYEFWGDSAEAAATVTRRDGTPNSFSVWWLKEERVSAAFVLARPDEEREFAQRAIREQLLVDAATLTDASRPIDAAYRKHAAGSGTGQAKT